MAALRGVRESVGDDRVTLLVDRGLEALPDALAGACDLTTEVTGQQVSAYSVLVQPSPMTGSPAPLVPMLHSSAYKVAVVFDFIPLHFPTIYLRHVAARVEYAAALDALRRYDDFVAISHDTAAELSRLVGVGTDQSPVVAWPRDVLPSGASLAASNGSGPIVVMTGDEPRKNTFGALAAIGAATAGGPSPRDVVVVGMAGQETRVHHWSVAAAMYPGETRTVGRLEDADMHRLLAEASLVVVASFDEGLSLPVIEALRCGTPVVASDIPAHRELLGSGSFLADPRRPRSIAAAIRRHAGKAATQQRQAARLTQHRHLALEEVLGTKAAQHVKAAVVNPPAAAVHVSGGALDVAIATPWAPQRTGVADFSTTTTIELARLADVTVYTTHDADVAGTTPADVRIRQAPVDALLDRGSPHDVLATVLGNSHFHLPFMAVAEQVESVVIGHDTRMVEYYLSLRDRGGVEQLMLRGTGRSRLYPALDDQIDDMRLLENAGFWEIARRARMLVMHAPSAAARIASETGVTPRLLPFANQRAPQGDVTEEVRAAARTRLGFDDGALAGTIHLATFGYVDLRTKMTDAVVEAAAWLSQWGHRVSLHVVGAAPSDVAAGLRDRAREAGIANFAITGFVSDEQFRDYLLAVDVGIQLRISPLLGVSGPLSDLAAYGTPSLASHGLAVDVDTPAYVERLPDEVSPVMVAEAVERLVANPMPLQAREQLRQEYLDAKSPRRYAEALLGLLTEAASDRRSP